jgi:hypothetical protein
VFKRYLPTATAFAAAALLSTGCGPVESDDSLDITDELGTRGDALTGAQFWHDLRAYSGTSGQCNSGVNISEGKALGQWTTRMRIDTDSRSGGCYQKFGILDPSGELSGLVLSVDFHGQANTTGDGQCDSPGIYQVPVGTSLAWTPSWGIDTGGNPGGCVQAFSISGRSDVALDVKFEDDGFNGQCDNAGTHTVTSAASKSIVFDMDDRGGGCFQSFRLRMMACGDAVCDPGETCDADCIICGDGICNGSETESSCLTDCDPCGNGYCAPNDPYTCPQDCETCGDGICSLSERFTCPEDCGGSCGMRICPDEPL